MELIADVPGLRARLDTARAQGLLIGFVPTMGSLHDGHLSLVRAAVARTDRVVVSIFVNPLQFAPTEDLAAYPRDLDADLALLEPLGIDCVFHPDAATLTPPGRRTTVHVAGLTDRFEGATRPTHFDGVTTIVTKLLSIVGPCDAYFGEKDFQQLTVIRRMAIDLDLPVEVVGCPLVRDSDGLALSSRNAYLSADERRDALVLHRALHHLAATWDGDADSARDALAGRISSAPGVHLDYAEVVDPETLEPLEGVTGGAAQALVAARVGATRLLDTMRLEPTG